MGKYINIIADRVNGQAPCKDCTERYSGCHSKCDSYINWSKNHKEFLDKVNKERKEEQILYGNYRRIHNGKGNTI